MTSEPAGCIRTLVVDDDFAVAALHAEFLRAIPGFTVVGEAHLGSEALRAARELGPDLVLLDLFLPDIFGLDLLRKLQAQCSEPVDVIAVTASREIETVRLAMSLGVNQYLVKPFTRAVFDERLRDYGRHRRELARRCSGSGPLDQQDVDRLMTARAMRPIDGKVPKGLSSVTLRLIADTLRSSPTELSAQEVGQRAGLSRVSARRYLEHLASCGQAQIEPRYGTANRPIHGYRWMSA